MKLTLAICRASLFVGALLWATVTPAQYRFESWNTDTGLPQNSINDIKQTRDGYVWLTTFDGLVRFDGVRFTVFDKGNTPGISSNRFLRMLEDSQGDLWAGTEEGGLVRYHQGRFSSYGKESGLTNLNVVYLTDHQGSVVAYFAGEGVMRFANEKLQPIKPPNRFEENDSTPRAAQRVPCSRNGERLSCLAYGSWSVADGLPSLDRVSPDAVDDGHGALWLATSDPALVRIEHGKVTKIYREHDGLPGRPVIFITGAHCRLLSLDQQGRGWLTDISNLQSWSIGNDLPAAI